MLYLMVILDYVRLVNRALRRAAVQSRFYVPLQAEKWKAFNRQRFLLGKSSKKFSSGAPLGFNCVGEHVPISRYTVVF